MPQSLLRGKCDPTFAVRSVVIAPVTLAQYALDVPLASPTMRAFLQRYGAWIVSGSPIAKVSVCGRIRLLNGV
jgi:hypothetical protein